MYIHTNVIKYIKRTNTIVVNYVKVFHILRNSNTKSLNWLRVSV